MKKLGAILLLGILFIFPLILQIVYAETPGLPSSLEQDPNELIEKAKNVTETKWDYLSKEWKNMLLKNSVVSAVDSFFTKISIVFRILFGMDYSLSITLFFVIVLWLVIFISIAKIIRSSMNFSPLASSGIGIAFAVILAQTQILRIIVTAIGTFMFSQEAQWARIILVSVAILALFFVLYKILPDYLEKRRKKKLDRNAEQSKKNFIALDKGRKEIVDENPFN